MKYTIIKKFSNGDAMLRNTDGEYFGGMVVVGERKAVLLTNKA